VELEERPIAIAYKTIIHWFKTLYRRRAMTVKELIEKLQDENPDALVYTMDDVDDLAFIVTTVSRNILYGQEETVTLH